VRTVFARWPLIDDGPHGGPYENRHAIEGPPVASDGRATAWSALAIILATGLALRIAAALAAQGYADRLGKPCLFGDTVIYRELARAIGEGRPFVVDQSGVPHYALRTPGYPAFLAACGTVFGDRLLPVRLVQAALGTLGVYFVYRLVDRAVGDRKAAIVAAGLAAVEPYGVGLGALILSEGVFIPLMLAGLWGLAVLWTRGEERPAKHGVVIAIGTGVVHGTAILVRPSWALMVPVLLACWVIGARREQRLRALRQALLVAAAAAVVMAPWWARNARAFGRFVPTALWVGASLYDGLSPSATGASDMTFLVEPGVVELDEVSQDAALRTRAIDFATTNPGRALGLAAIKAARFWSPWPNAETLRSPLVAWASAAITIPLFALVAIGAWQYRRDGRALILLLGPLVYFMTLHMIFVSSIRYRIPGFLPALGLAAVGLRSVFVGSAVRTIFGR
jgi:4-amino-4-deoxy-L-arabinose transferase-like glycosyltransferase